MNKTKALIPFGIAAAVILVWGRPISGQTPLTPGQITNTPEELILQSGLAGTEGLGAIVSIDAAHMRDGHDKFVNRVWIASMLAMVAASALDAGTAWGKRERNGLLASSDGTFGAKGVSIKVAAGGAIIIPEILFRKSKHLRTKFTVGNFAEAAVFTGIAIHNSQISGPIR
jgi:hypothetical protein